MTLKEFCDNLTTMKKTILLLVFFVTIALSFNAIYARNSELSMVAMRLDEKIEKDRLWELQERIWNLEAYYKCVGEADCFGKMPPSVYEEYRRVCYDKSEKERELNKRK